MYKKIVVMLGVLFLTSCVNNPPTRGSSESSSYGTRDVEVVFDETQTYPRVALIIGNNNYQRNRVLKNAIADARAVKTFFANKGFKIIDAEDADYNEMKAKVNEFISSLSPKSVAVIYYAGHASQDRSRKTGEITNYLVPVNDSSLTTITDYDRDAISLNYILNKADEINHGLNIAMLDACRTPIGRGGTIENISAEGIYLVYSTASGATASDSGAFRRSFLKYAQSSMKFNDIFLAVKRDLIKTGQKPIINDETNGEPFYFNKPKPIIPSKPQVVQSVPQQSSSKWITPKDSVCKANGGKIDKDGICESNWEDAKKICRASGGSLPSIKVLGQVITDCGGILNNKFFGKEAKKNTSNSNYQSCYKDKGFTTSSQYWSSTSYSNNNERSWLVHFYGGDQSNNYKYYDFYVRCIRAGQ